MVSSNSTGIDSEEIGRVPNRTLSSPSSITVMPGNPRAAQTAASAFPATATRASNPKSPATRLKSFAIFSGEPKSLSQPERSRTTVSYLFSSSPSQASSTRGEMVHAQSRSAACALASAADDRHRQITLGHTSASAFVMPTSTPAAFARLFAENTFVRGAEPSRTATGWYCNSASWRTTACTGKWGTKRQANGTAASHQMDSNGYDGNYALRDKSRRACQQMLSARPSRIRERATSASTSKPRKV